MIEDIKNVAINARILQKGVLEGVGRYIWENTKRMVLTHPNTTFYFFFDREYDTDYVIAENVIPIVISPPARHPFLFLIWFELGVYKALNKYNIHVFFSGDNFLCLRTKVPTLLVVHDLAYLHYPEHITFLARWYYRWMMPRFIKRADHIITVSSFVKQDILNQFSSIEPTKITVGYNALPSRNLNVLQSENPGLDYIVYLGSLNPRKNIHNLIEAFQVVNQKHPTLKLVLIGRKSNLNQNTEELLSKRIGEGTVLHYEGISDKDVMNWLKCARAMVYVSYFEGFGIPLLEAMSVGLPIVTSNVSSMPEIAKDAAVLVSPHSKDEIASAIIEVIENPNIRDALVNRGYERLKDFSWDTTSEMIYGEIKSLASKN